MSRSQRERVDEVKFFQSILLGFCLIGCFSGAACQTVTTSGGTSNTIPMFSGSTTLTNSAITQSNGNVGIGTTSPDATLTVVSSAQNAISLGRNDGVVKDINFFEFNGGNNYGIRFNGQNPGFYRMSFLSNGGEALSVSQNGNVGVGTTNPGTLLQLDQAGSSNRTQKLSLPGVYNFENVYLGQYGNGDNGLEFINHTGPVNSYGIKLQANIDSNVEGLQIQVAPPASSYDSLSYVTAMTVLASNGNVGIGTTNPGSTLEVNGNIALTNGKGGSVIFQDGSKQSTAWTGSLCGGDYAESIDVSDNRGKYEPGDVLVIDPNAEGKFLKSTEPYSMAVAGVYSTKPGVVGRRQTTTKNPDEIPMAVIGIVPVKVIAENGPIHPGDILVTSSTAGYAMRGTDRSRMFQAVIGKAMGSLASGTGLIEVLVSLQ